MINTTLNNQRIPYMETDEWGKKWIDANCKEFWQGNHSFSKNQTKKALRSLKEKGLMSSKRGANNKKLYCINEYGTEKFVAKNLGKRTRSLAEMPCVEEVIEKKVFLDLGKKIYREIKNDLSYRPSIIS